MSDFDRGYKAAVIDALAVCQEFAKEQHEYHKNGDPQLKSTRQFFLGGEKTALNILDAIAKLEPFEVIN